MITRQDATSTSVSKAAQSSSLETIEADVNFSVFFEMTRMVFPEIKEFFSAWYHKTILH